MREGCRLHNSPFKGLKTDLSPRLEGNMTATDSTPSVSQQLQQPAAQSVPKLAMNRQVRIAERQEMGLG